MQASPMKPWLQFCVAGARAGVGCLGSFALWTLWLALVLLLALQLYVATSHELAVPGFVLRRLEDTLAGSGLKLTFGRASFDPQGRVLVRDVRFFLPAFPDPIFTARAVFVRLDPRALLMARIEPGEILLTGATAAAPAQLTPSGRTEEIVRDLETVLEPRGRELVLHQCSARVANLTFSAHGTIPLPRTGEKTPLPLVVETLARHFPDLCRRAIVATARLAQCEQPTVLVELAPSASGAPVLAVTALARRLTLEQPIAAQIDDLQAATRLFFLGATPPAPLELSAREVRLGNGAVARGVEADVFGRLAPGATGFELREAVVTVDALAAEGVETTALSARLAPRPLPLLAAVVTARVFDAPLALRGEANLEARTGSIRFDGAISPRILEVISRRVGVDVRRYYDFESLEAHNGEVSFGPGWKFEQLTARVHVPRMNSYGVPMEDGRAAIELRPGWFYAPEAFARIGANFARGTFEQNLRTREYRFLLDGQLRPLEISPWFGPWWPNFFRQFEFPAGPPAASVEVTGVWREARKARIFVFAETAQTIIRGTAFDRTRSRLFIRPGFYDGLEVSATRADGAARGSFTYRTLPPDHEWDSLAFDVDSTFDLSLASQLIGPAATRALAPFRLAAAPALKARGRILGPKTRTAEAQDQLHLEARTTGEFRFHEFPLHDVFFTATLKGDDVSIDRFIGAFAGGSAKGHARVWGRGDDRRLGFDLSLENANLGQAATTLQTFLALQKKQPPAPPGRFVQERANVQLDLAASAEGRYADPLGFHGEGNAVLRGAGIGEVPLLGLLSELFTFASLRFNEARGNFKIDGPKLVFPQIELRGANSLIEAQGHFALDQRQLLFNARIFPFQESESVIKSVVGAVLSPLSNALEVKLTGTLDKPQWAFVMGPTNFLRALAEPASAKPAPAPSPTEPAPAEKRGP